MKKILPILLTAALGGCSATPSSPRVTAGPEVPLESPSAWRSGIVDQSIREARERQLIRELGKEIRP